MYRKFHLNAFNIVSSTCVISALTRRLTVEWCFSWSFTKTNMSEISLEEVAHFSKKFLHQFNVCLFSFYVKQQIKKDGWNYKQLVFVEFECIDVKFERLPLGCMDECGCWFGLFDWSWDLYSFSGLDDFLLVNNLLRFLCKSETS